MPKRCFMPPEKVESAFLRTSHRFVCCSSVSTIALRSAAERHPLHNGQMLQHVERGYLGIHPELLRQVAKNPANLVFLAEHVDAIEIDAARVGILQRGNGAHQRTLSRAVRPHQAEHAIADRK